MYLFHSSYMKRILPILFVILSAVSVQSQEYTHYTTIDGLSGTDVTAICENENFLWIATNDGLNRFDGREFKVYRNDNTSANSISENNIETLMFDSQGFLWIGFKTGGVDIFNPRKNKFIHISDVIKDYPQRVICIYEDSKKNIWLGTWEDGLYQLTPTNEGDLSYHVSKHYPKNIVSSIVEKPKGKLWIGTYYGFFLYDIENKRDVPLKENYYAVTQFLDTGEKNSLWFSVWTNGLYKLEWDEKTFRTKETSMTKNMEDVYRIFPATDNKLYLGTWGNGVKVTQMLSDAYPESLQIDAPVILSFYRDRHRRFWVGTYGTGLFRLNDKSRGITNLSPINTNGLSAAYSLRYFGSGQLLIGTQGDGLYLYDIKNHNLRPQFIKNTGSLFHKYILSLYRDNEVLIVGNDDTGLQYAPLKGTDNTNFTLRTYHVDKNFGKVTAIFKSSNSTFWIGTKQYGLVSMKYDPAKENFTNYIHYDSFGMDEITGFSETIDGQIWVSSHSGIYLFDPVTNKVQKYNNASEMIYSLADDQKNKCLWLGTSGGLRKLSYTGDNKIENPFSSEVLPDGAIRDVILDTYNNLWFSASNRIFCYTDSSRELKEINPGTPNQQLLFSTTRCETGGKQYVIFGGTNSILLIDPQVVLNQPEHTKILLTELQIDHQTVDVGEKIYGKIVLNEDTEYINSITLSYLCKWISLSFTEVGWDNYYNSYQYQIKGFSDDWQYLDITKPITFSQLPPGNYTLQIRLNNTSLNDKNEPLWSLHIAITPPWWQTGTFYLVLSLAIFMILLSLFFIIKNYYKKRQLQKLGEIEKKKKEELLQEKESFFAGLSHDLLTPFSLIIAPVSDMMRDETMNEEQHEKLEIISKNATFLSDVFSTILDFKRAEQIDTEIKEKNIELVSFVNIIVNAFDYLAKSDKIKLSYHSAIPNLYISIDSIKLERILYNLISNALKFTKEEGEVDVLLDYDEVAEVFYLKVKDTGIGIRQQNQEKVFEKFYREDKDSDTQGLGLGLYSTRKFLHMMGGEVHIESIPEKGTAFTINLPAKRINEPKPILDIKETVDTDGLFTILLVEDNTQLRDYLRKKLAVHFEVAVASNGAEALDFIKSNLPEIVVSDVVMPEMDGLTLCSIIKNTPMYSEVFVILLSARSSSEDEMQGYKAGADFYIKKPFDPEILIKQMVNVYATRQQRRKQIITDLLSPQNDSAKSHPKDDFLGKAVKIIEEHIMDENFKIDEFAAEMNLSKTVLHRKFKLIVGETPNIFIRNIRLHKAANMLKETDLSISEIGYLTGFSQAHYFIKCFKELYQYTPKNFRVKNKTGDTHTETNESN
ncbi:Signal transduction histidine kinase [Dysgonomonas macrotermitis]|uniref:histidine kinase n=2 Tax=Dysgonomonas macrotermitis TaxID=1346286 RepID=A0A1M4Y1D2_9BACT|nr:Signal transduction histidine kinase [Dysgonomonas macrotermitis]